MVFNGNKDLSIMSIIFLLYNKIIIINNNNIYIVIYVGFFKESTQTISKKRGALTPL